MVRIIFGIPRGEWSSEDGCFVGICPGLMFGGVLGPDEAKVYAELCQAVEEVIALMEAEGHRLPRYRQTELQWQGAPAIGAGGA
ncbi:MAG TPA: pilus assembly protein HicB [Verrucomicrobiota bacterium]|nr:pilus assembly protein HicB [Verrucomicrobiota bacterium]